MIGISVSNLKPSPMLESCLFKDKSKEDNLSIAIEKISDKFGDDKITMVNLTSKELK